MKVELSRQERLAAYADLCASAYLPLFSQPWWLNAVAGPNWDVTLSFDKAGRPNGALPFTTVRRYTCMLLGQPPLTPFLGPWLLSSTAKPAKAMSQHNETMTTLIDALPRHSVFSQNWSPEVTNWLPFYWQGFRQTTRYTYRLEDLQDERSIWAGMHESLRREIRKARDRHRLVVTTTGVETLLDLADKTFGRQGLALPYDKALLHRIDSACQPKRCARALVAFDPSGRPHAGAYLVWDELSAYYLVGGADPVLRNSGAASLCLWEAVKFAATVSRSFDFEGSMIRSVERFFRSFGGTQVPYFRVTGGRGPLGALWSVKKALSREVQPE